MAIDGHKDLFLYALRLLGARAYSESALRRKLARGANPEVVEAVLSQIKSLGYLDDRGYAEGYVRLHAGKWGVAKLRRMLLEKGVSRSIVDQVLTEWEAESDPVDEALALLSRYISRHRGEKQRALRFLTSRGFALKDAHVAWERYRGQQSGCPG